MFVRFLGFADSERQVSPSKRSTLFLVPSVLFNNNNPARYASTALLRKWQVATVSNQSSSSVFMNTSSMPTKA